ncbi:MAG: SDR family oxidoreductase [Alphaproteobacteria bacterium]|nr:SDR family oxidoreductase [Alphaproteobacteria bacterium]
MTQEFDGKVAVVTGSSGIGLAAALKLARDGARVFLGGIDDAHNEAATRKATGLSLSVERVDVAEEAQVAEWINRAGSEAGGIDILVNAAAIQTYGDIETTDAAHWDRVMNINLRSCFLTSHHAYPHMKPRKSGSIIHVASVQGHANQNNVLAYATTKGAVHALTRAMAVDCAKDNIRVNSVSPGSVRTPLLEYAAREIAGPGNPIEDTIASFGEAHPMGRVGTIDETSELIAFLAGDRSGFCTGGDYLIDGGLTAHIGV